MVVQLVNGTSTSDFNQIHKHVRVPRGITDSSCTQRTDIIVVVVRDCLLL